MNLKQAFSLVAALGMAGCGSEGSGPGGTGGSPAGTGGESAPPSGTGGSTTVGTGGTSAGTGGASTTPKGTGGATAPSGTGGTTQSSADAGAAPPIDGGAPIAVPKFVGNITSSGGRTDVGSLKFADYWNQVSPQNEGKWGSVSNAKGQYNWSALDTMYKYTEANKMVFKEHTFMWGAQQPGYAITESDVKDWMTQFCKRYPNTRVIDVVNEPPPHTQPSYANSIGGGTNGDWAWIANAFKWAREACPNAVLVLNDYNNLEWDKDNQHFIDIVKAIQKLGAPIDAIGCQAHDLDHMAGSTFDVTLDGVKTRMANLIAALPSLYITEMDISTKDDAAQLTLYKQYFPLFWESPNVKGITIWGWVVGQTWSMAPDSGLITSSGSKRPAFTWLLQQIGKG
jgi:endo-1,4-beta-xylanase